MGKQGTNSNDIDPDCQTPGQCEIGKGHRYPVAKLMCMIPGDERSWFCVWVGCAVRRRGGAGRHAPIKSGADGRPYFDLIREMKSAYNHRLRLVESVRQRGIKPTARLFCTSPQT